MCIVPKKKKPQTRNQLVTAKESEFSRKGYELPTNIRQTTGNSAIQKQPRVGDVHRKLKTAEINLTLEEQKRQLMLAQEAMGLKPNTTIIEKIAERQKKMEATQDASVVRSVIQSSSKMGDIQYSLFKKPKKDDDTVCPDALKGEMKEEKKEQPSGGCNTPNPEEELLNEDEEVEEPNSENYMFNQREIIYTCHTMVRTMGNLDQSDYGEGHNDSKANVRWDPFAALEELQTREFTCHLLRRGTFISNTLTQATAAEKEKKQPIKHDSNKSKVRIMDKVLDLAEFNARNEMTIVSETQSKSQFDVSSRTKKEKKQTPTLLDKRPMPSTGGGKSREAPKTVEKTNASAEKIKKSASTKAIKK